MDGLMALVFAPIGPVYKCGSGGCDMTSLSNTTLEPVGMMPNRVAGEADLNALRSEVGALGATIDMIARPATPRPNYIAGHLVFMIHCSSMEVARNIPGFVPFYLRLADEKIEE